ncbi:MAG: hypothetical protein ACYC7D_14665 [Nitrososphaerales archaeon]
MPEILEGRALSRRLLDRYSRKPSSWSFTIAPAMKDGFYDALVSSPDESWQLKIDSIFNPLPKMLGAQVELDRSKVKKFSPISYGYRKLDPETVMKLLTSLEGEELSKYKTMDSVLGPLDPVAPKTGGSYAEGPFVFTNEKLSSGQSELDDKLSSELRKLMRSRLSAYG